MAKNLEGLLNRIKEKKQSILTRLKSLYKEKIDGLRPYIASLGALSIGVANWSKDFAYNPKVILPFVDTYLSIGGHLWYNLALAQEAFTIGSITATSNNKLKTAKYAIAYELGSFVNAALYYTTLKSYPLGAYYGDIWNNIFFFYQIPMFFMLLKSYLKKSS